MRISHAGHSLATSCGLPPDAPFPHNGGVTNPQMKSACPRCGNTDAVHSIQELAALASGQLSQLSQVQAGQQHAGPVRGWEAEPRSGPLPGPGGFGGGLRNTLDYGAGGMSSRPLDALGDDIAGAAVSAAMGFAARAISRRVERTMTERVVPTVMARQQTVLQAQIEIARRHPDLCACMTDQVIFLAGGSRALPLPNLMTVTVEQADQMVAQLRDTVT
jgi:hypothetical protein